MDHHIPPELYPQSDQDKYLNIAHKDRWECLKPVIVELYEGSYGAGGRTLTLNQVVGFMKANYSFHAAPTEYRPRLRAWGIAKRITKDMKDGALDALARRKRPATSTSQVTVTRGGHEQQLHPNKLMRHLKEQKRHPVVEYIMPGLLSSWNFLYEAFIASISNNQDGSSPFKPLGATPECLNVKSPTPLTPGRETAAPSLNMQLVYEKAKKKRAILFLNGRLKELVGDMCRDDRKLLVNYFHDFYMNGFVMAKNWGRQPPDGQTVAGAVPFPQRWPIETPSYYSSLALSPSVFGSPNRTDISKAPTQVCKWTIHVPPPMGDARCITYYQPVEQSQERPTVSSFPDELHQSMLNSNFTSIPLQDLPLAQEVIGDAIKNDPKALEIDAWKLAIMAGNYELLGQLFTNNGDEAPHGIEDIHPLHLAASFLNGGLACCRVFEVLSRTLGLEYAFYHNIDKYGHTVLDALIISILRSHTKIDPGSVSYAFRSPNRFPGEEVDICGRWGPDTPKVRDLFQQGFSRIPNTWKHPFCHTAVQAVCHSIITIYGPACAPNINKRSGLFIRRCTECGMGLRLGPLHTLVVTTFYLAQSGMAGETLFGAIAVLMCLLSLGADGTLTANISVEEILGASETVNCRHIDLSPRELMERVPKEVTDDWTDDCKVGWSCFAQILSRAEKDGRSQPDVGSDIGRGGQSGESFDDTSPMRVSNVSRKNKCHLVREIRNDVHGGWLNLKCHDADMGLLWATIQTEVLTYRRLNEGDSWISENFSLRALEYWLSGNSADFLTPLVNDRMMQAHSKCGWFHEAECFVIATAQEVCARYFMNMDIYERATYTDVPYLWDLWESIEPLTDEST
ncbi:hypothetical protein F4823DRAFT_451238 [Ustulina deusta]|nr:hypothetical protein F4823DRAFT_451238 [Ustulina deusta]